MDLLYDTWTSGCNLQPHRLMINLTHWSFNFRVPLNLHSFISGHCEAAQQRNTIQCYAMVVNHSWPSDRSELYNPAMTDCKDVSLSLCLIIIKTKRKRDTEIGGSMKAHK